MFAARKYRRVVDFEILMIAQEVAEIAEEMDLLDEEIIEEVLNLMEKSDLFCHVLMMRNPEIENVAIMGEGNDAKLILLFKDKHGVIVNRRRTRASSLRHLIQIAA